MPKNEAKDTILRALEVAVEVIGMIIMLLPLIQGRRKTK